MKRIIYFLFCLCTVCTVVRSTAADTYKGARLFGHVVDKNTHEHLSYIPVFLKGTTYGTTTDESGHYRLDNLPEGEFTVVMKSIGYKTSGEKRPVG